MKEKFNLWYFNNNSAEDCLKKLGIEVSSQNVSFLKKAINPRDYMKPGDNRRVQLELEFWDRVRKLFPKIFSFDAETNGLWGKAFSVAAIVYNTGKEIARFVGRCPIDGEINSWVAENVLPKMEDIPITHNSYDELLADFAKFYLVNKADAHIIVHMGVPVESKLFTDAHDRGFIGDWDGPYPLIDVAGNLQQAGENPTSCDSYVVKYGLEVAEGNTHNPLYDSEVAAKVFMHLRSRTSNLGEVTISWEEFCFL